MSPKSQSNYGNGINIEEDFVSDCDKLLESYVCIFNIRKFAKAEMTSEVFALTANIVYLRK